MNEEEIKFWAKQVINDIVTKKPDIKHIAGMDVLLTNLGEVIHVTFLDNDNNFGNIVFHKQGEKITEYEDQRTLLYLIKQFDDYKTETDDFKHRATIATICLIACLIAYSVTYYYTQEFSALISITISMFFGFNFGKRFLKEN